MKTKHSLLLTVFSLIVWTALSAQTTREQADEIVLEHINIELRPYTVYAKEGGHVEDMIITTSAGEVIETDYPCWVYYINYVENADSYLIVNKSNGNLLEINAKSDAMPDGLTEWRIIAPIEIPFTDYLSFFTDCSEFRFDREKEVIIINSNEEFEESAKCWNDYPVIDFSKQTLIGARFDVQPMWPVTAIVPTTSFLEVGQ
jgi:hypothetical protein